MALVSDKGRPFNGPNSQAPIGVCMIDATTAKQVIVYASDRALLKLEPLATDGLLAVFTRNRAIIEAAAKKKFDFSTSERSITILSHEV